MLIVPVTIVSSTHATSSVDTEAVPKTRRRDGRMGNLTEAEAAEDERKRMLCIGVKRLTPFDSTMP